MALRVRQLLPCFVVSAEKACDNPDTQGTSLGTETELLLIISNYNGLLHLLNMTFYPGRCLMVRVFTIS